MEQLDSLFVISLKSSPTEKHVSNFTKSQGSMGLYKVNISWGNIHIPFSKVSVHQNQQINDV